MIYLDFNRTTPIAPSVLEAMEPYWATHFLLPSQRHVHAHAVGEALENAREEVGALFNCEPFEVVFTSGGTEANNLAIGGLLGQQEPGHVLVSELEHESVLYCVRVFEATGWEVELLECGADGIIDPNRVAEQLREGTSLVCVQAANPVLGTLQPLREICDIAHNRGVPVHCDATQVFGKMPVDVRALRADTVSMSGHKFYAPKGTGALFVRRGLQLSPVVIGEPREMGVRPGAENVAGWVGLGAAARLASKCSADAQLMMEELSVRFAKGFRSLVDCDIQVVCDEFSRLPNTVCLQLPVSAALIQDRVSDLVFATAQSMDPPDEIARSLRAIGKSDQQIAQIARFSFGWTTSQEDVDRAIELLAQALDGSLG